MFGLTRRAHLAEDLTQETFVKAWAGLPKLQTVISFRGWLFRIARNCLYGGQRGPRGAATQLLPDDFPSREEEPLRNLLDGEAQEQLQAALERLPRTYRAAYLLLSQQDFSYSQIAFALEITEETARWRVCKARQFLLKELRAYLDSSP